MANAFATTHPEFFREQNKILAIRKLALLMMDYRDVCDEEKAKARRLLEHADGPGTVSEEGEAVKKISVTLVSSSEIFY